MPYDERFITPMRQELTRLGVQELRTPEEVDQALAEAREPTLLVVNSMCGCAARNARPGVRVHPRLPALVALHRPAQGRRRGVHAGAPPDRGPHRRGHRPGPRRRLRAALLKLRPTTNVGQSGGRAALA